MSEFFEMWSLPWHALQRSLAKSGEALGVQAQAQTSPSGTPPCAGAAPAAGNWLMRDSLVRLAPGGIPGKSLGEFAGKTAPRDATFNKNAA